MNHGNCELWTSVNDMYIIYSMYNNNGRIEKQEENNSL